MTERQNFPTAGYDLVDLYATEQRFEILPEGHDDLAEESRQVDFLWNWRVLGDEGANGADPEEGEGTERDGPINFEIAFGTEVGGTVESRSRIYVLLAARFRLKPGEATVEPLTFVQVHGVAVMMAYLRQHVSDLSAKGPYDPYHLPIMHVSQLMKEFDPRSTVGWGQLQENHDLAHRLGVEIEQLELTDQEES